MTPEGKLKNKVKIVLKTFGDKIWWDMPVPTGFGKSQLDFTGCAKGRFFAIETKAPGGKLTARQERTAYAMRKAGAEVFEFDDEEQLLRLYDWLTEVTS